MNKCVSNFQVVNSVHIIPLRPVYDRLYNIKYIEKIEIYSVYRANWIDGYINDRNNENTNWKRFNQNMFVNLKCLNNPINIALEFMNEVY
jgi:hypothetical protein